jgi:hypothetical protein
MKNSMKLFHSLSTYGLGSPYLVSEDEASAMESKIRRERDKNSKEKKQCMKCKKLKLVSAFTYLITKARYHSHCKECLNVFAKRRRKEKANGTVPPRRDQYKILAAFSYTDSSGG